MSNYELQNKISTCTHTISVLKCKIEEHEEKILQLSGKVWSSDKAICELEKEVIKNKDLSINMNDKVNEKLNEICKLELEYSKINKDKEQKIENEIEFIENYRVEVRQNIAPQQQVIINTPSPTVSLDKPQPKRRLFPDKELSQKAENFAKIKLLEDKIAKKSKILENIKRKLQNDKERNELRTNPSSISLATLVLSFLLGVLIMTIISSINPNIV